MIDNNLRLSSNLLLLNLDELTHDQDVVLHLEYEHLLSIVEIIIISNQNKITINIINCRLRSIGDNIRLLINKKNILQLRN